MTTLQAPPGSSNNIPAPYSLQTHALNESIEEISRRLLVSSAELSYDPSIEVDWDAPLDENLYGLCPEWSTLYDTPLWDEMTQAQRITLTRHEVSSVMSTGIWFEMILQQLIMRDQYTKDHSSAEFRYSLTECADECRHSIMFSRASEKMGASGYFPSRPVVEAARALKSFASGEIAYAGILVAEEMLDIMQRDWMRGENVLPMVRTTSMIHVVEESRHMKFARQEIRDNLKDASKAHLYASSLIIACAAQVILGSMVNPRVYLAAGLDPKRARREAAQSPHRKAMLRTSCVHLMDFLGDVKLLTPVAARIYRRNGML